MPEDMRCSGWLLRNPKDQRYGPDPFHALKTNDSILDRLEASVEI